MIFRYKYLLKLVLPAIFLIMSSNAYAVKWVGEAGLHTGGDELITATTTAGESQDIEGGGLYSISTGLQFDIDKTSNIRALIGYKADSITASNGSFDWDRIPIDVMYFYQTQQWSFGGGLTYHMNPEFSGSATGLNPLVIDIKFKDALGYVLEVDYRLGKSFYVGAKYTAIDYEYESFANEKIDGNSIGVVIGFVFGGK